jgi:hypothetical protein
MSVILATAGYDHKIRFWEAPSGICTRILKYPDSQGTEKVMDIGEVSVTSAHGCANLDVEQTGRK